MLTFGLEQEYFVLDSHRDIILPFETQSFIAVDGGGYLAEARGKPYASIVEAVYSLYAAKKEIEIGLETAAIRNKEEYTLSISPREALSAKQIDSLRRKYTKEIVKYNNYLGHLNHRVSGKIKTAGTHISLCEERSTYSARGPGIKYNMNFDWMRWFLLFDKAFKEEIKNSYRNPGFYELKSDGRIEYRSLPNNINMDKLINVIQTFQKGS
jgi:hypothetical protein